MSNSSAEPPTPSPTGQHPNDVRVAGWLDMVKGLSLTNVLIIALLVLIAFPVYVFYRAMGDESLMSRIFSHYTEYSTDKSPCTLREAAVRSGPYVWAISTGFAFQGSDRWVVGVHLDRKPTNDELESYCATLNLIVDFMRRPGGGASPTYPNSTEPLIWKYPAGEGEGASE